MVQIIIAVILIAAIVALTFKFGGVDPAIGSSFLKAMGMSDITVSGYTPFGCSEGDLYRSKFAAKGADGKPVTGTLCSGVWKGVTVRFD